MIYILVFALGFLLGMIRVIHAFNSKGMYLNTQPTEDTE